MDSKTAQSPALAVDFTGGSFDYRRRRVSRSEPLLRAVGLKSGKPLVVADATAGLGRDGFLLATAGATVILIERSDQVADALESALERARSESAELAEIVSRISLLRGDSLKLLGTLKVDVVTIDPMHPERAKSALVKQEMRDLRALVGADEDREALILSALARNPGRVVVKWPLRAPLPTSVPPPNHEIMAKTVRFAVFVRR